MNLEKNKENAIAFYKTAYEGNPKKAVDLYVGDQYIQHNPEVADGLSGFIDYFERMQKEYPEKSIEFVRCIAEGELVALHTHTRFGLAMTNMLRWTFFDLTKTEKSVNIGIQSNRYPKNQ